MARHKGNFDYKVVPINVRQIVVPELATMRVLASNGWQSAEPGADSINLADLCVLRPVVVHDIGHKDQQKYELVTGLVTLLAALSQLPESESSMIFCHCLTDPEPCLLDRLRCAEIMLVCGQVRRTKRDNMAFAKALTRSNVANAFAAVGIPIRKKHQLADALGVSRVTLNEWLST